MNETTSVLHQVVNNSSPPTSREPSNILAIDIISHTYIYIYTRLAVPTYL